MKLYEETISREDIYSGRIINVHVDKVRLENGNEASREVVEHPGGVCVAIVNDRQEIFFVRQFRYPYGEAVLELPAGKLEKGEDPFKAVKREQLEETGTIGRDYIFLGDAYPSPGYCGEIIRLWCCRTEREDRQQPDEDEFLEVEKIHYREAVRLVMENRIPDAKTQILILKTARLIEEGVI